MENNLNTFLDKSPIASKVRLPARIVIHRTKLSPKEIMEIKTSGTYGPVEKTEYELVCGEQVLAKGKIVNKKGEYFFKVNELY